MKQRRSLSKRSVFVAAALAGLVSLATHTTGAQAATVLSNMTNAHTTNVGATSGISVFQAFTVGSAGNYILNSLSIFGSASSASFSSYLANMQILADNVGAPGSTVVATMNSATVTPSLNGSLTFIAPANITLSSSTKYWIKLNGTTDAVTWYTTSNASFTGDAGWSINGGITSSNGMGSETGKFSVDATLISNEPPAAVPLPSAALSGGALMGFQLLRGRRR